MVHRKETKKKNEFIEMKSVVDKKMNNMTIDFGNAETRPNVWVEDGDDIAIYIIKMKNK